MQNAIATAELFSDDDLPGIDGSIAEFKQCIADFHTALQSAFVAGIGDDSVDIRYLVALRASFTDSILQQAWKRHITDKLEASLIAVGGYGRSELHPASDIDLMILLASEEDDATKQCLEQLLMFLWDIGLEVGHSVRTLQECIAEAEKDITVVTNLLESRLLIGDKALYSAMQSATGPDKIWPSDAFFEAKWQEQKQRHLKYHDSAYNLEPNIKANPGGLRDIQMIGWVAKRHFGCESMHELLVNHQFLTEEEFELLRSGEELLWKIRFALHITVGRREDRLLFDHQRKLAKLFGYSETENNQAIESFMQKYYRMVIELNRLNEMLLQLFQEAILLKEKIERVVINERFQSVNGYLEVTHENVFTNQPSALIELFVILAENENFKGVRASTIRLVRQSCDLIDDDFRQDKAIQKLFLSLFTRDTGLTHELRRMNRYGILAAYLPAFENIVGRMQYDLFHVYTVDEHTMFAVRNLRRFTVAEFQDEFPLCSDIINNLSMPHIVYLAALFHDIAKGRGGDHAKLGAVDAMEFCELHGLSSYESNLVSWLVKKHLLMSMTAQRKDIDDPEVIMQFANIVADPIRLDCLYLLTVADSRATNPGRWNDYKGSLLNQLYLSARKALARGLDNPQDQAEIVRLRKDYSLAELVKDGYSHERVTNLWETLDDDYFMHSSPEEVIWQSKTVLKAHPEIKPVVEIKRQSNRGGTEIFVCTEDADNVFSIMTILLAQQGLKILNARIHSAGNSCTMNDYIVHEQDDSYIASSTRMDEIIEYLREGLQHPENVTTQINSHVKRQIKILGVPPEIVFTQDRNNQLTKLRLKATDRPELLATISRIFIQENIRVHSAKISTVGAQVEDIFLITNKDNEPIRDLEVMKCLSKTIVDALSEYES
jgi:[protein-PII] uridylyltransferase